MEVVAVAVHHKYCLELVPLKIHPSSPRQNNLPALLFLITSRDVDEYNGREARVGKF